MEFISPLGSKSRKCGGIMWAVGWRKGYKGLEILGRYCHQKAIDANPLGFETLMADSLKAGEVIFNTFYSFGGVASPFGFASNLAFSFHGFYNHHHKDDGDASELPLAFALIIPTSKETGKIATKHHGYNAQEYVHGTLNPTEPSCFTKLNLSLQVATKASCVCQNYLNSKYNDNSDEYFGGVPINTVEVLMSF
ncbi:hypothetical protein PSTT_06897 [Puccinia striiformis]|uniref:Tet-like 2OG-Fe(II) oxygenase domain-containing protein n=1 Tax=Puccinia striiformis TaxID=27350 RepID=A0A2S4VIF0_9BASI|nr:hypothetical protein PSTT_06897 [Puccinia striiformis]